MIEAQTVATGPLATSLRASLSGILSSRQSPEFAASFPTCTTRAASQRRSAQIGLDWSLWARTAIAMRVAVQSEFPALSASPATNAPIPKKRTAPASSKICFGDSPRDLHAIKVDRHAAFGLSTEGRGAPPAAEGRAPGHRHHPAPPERAAVLRPVKERDQRLADGFVVVSFRVPTVVKPPLAARVVDPAVDFSGPALRVLCAFRLRLHILRGLAGLARTAGRTDALLRAEAVPAAAEARHAGHNVPAGRADAQL